METRKSVLRAENLDTLTSINNLAFDVQQPRVVEKGRRAGDANNGDKKEGAWGGASRHADQHKQPSVDVQGSRAVKGGQRALCASNGDKFEGARGGASRHAN